MRTDAISAERAAQLEMCETNAWLDMYAAAPSEFVRQFQLEIMRVGPVVFTRCKHIPFIHFNCVKNFGVTQPATEAILDQIIATYHEAGIHDFTFYHILQAQPAELPAWFQARKLRLRGGWDRIYRTGAPLAADPIAVPADMHVEKVTSTNATDWATFIDRLYGLPTTPWLLALVGRPGWHHYLLRQRSEVAAVRTMYVSDGMAWFGIDTPVPGIMAPSYALDAQVCQVMVRDGLALGVQLFAADIEAPSVTQDTPAYDYFGKLGFTCPYFREHYG